MCIGRYCLSCMVRGSMGKAFVGSCRKKGERGGYGGAGGSSMSAFCKPCIIFLCLYPLFFSLLAFAQFRSRLRWGYYGPSLLLSMTRAGLCGIGGPRHEASRSDLFKRRRRLVTRRSIYASVVS